MNSNSPPDPRYGTNAVIGCSGSPDPKSGTVGDLATDPDTNSVYLKTSEGWKLMDGTSEAT